MNKSKYATHGLEIHFAVSKEISTRFGKDSVAHMGFSIGNTSYNTGRCEGRNSKRITSHGPFVTVCSPYRDDGYIVRLGNSNNVCRYVQEFVDGYLSNAIDRKGDIIYNDQNTATTLPPQIIDNLWFVKVVKGLSRINEIKNVHISSELAYESTIKSKYSLLDSVTYEKFSKFVNTKSDNVELKILKKAYPFFSEISLGNYSKIKSMSRDKITDFIHIVTGLKSRLGNRLYPTYFMHSADFNNGNYKMLASNNCVRATFFFLKNGLNFAQKKLKDNAVEQKEITEIEKFVSLLREGNKNFCIPWRSYRQAKRNSHYFPNIGFLDSPKDGIYWKDIKKNIKETRLTNISKRKSCSNKRRKKIMEELVKKTDVTCYEKQGLDFVSKSKVSTREKNKFNTYNVLLKDFKVDEGGGNHTRYEEV